MKLVGDGANILFAKHETNDGNFKSGPIFLIE